MPAVELEKCFSKPISSKPCDTTVPAEMHKARDKFVAKHKLALILKSKSTYDVPLSVRDSVEIFLKSEKDKHGHWTIPRNVKSVNKEARNITVPGKKGKQIKDALEDILVVETSRRFQNATGNCFM
eukprot:gb/GEZJ01007357.1/.p1 GENE.gb/GEZJ01007357.1/~~gb/GEZJ01007357.1/.p1  ORF type:complete len:126 (-),score=13.31 gb/GEZJ01007357.1/:52-429(-)